ncbi:hypothetical protein [Bradyrhizobium sp. UFLA05-112]
MGHYSRTFVTDERRTSPRTASRMPQIEYAVADVDVTRARDAKVRQ